MALVVRRLEGRLRDLLGRNARLPRVLMTDRGTVMYTPSGQAVMAYEAAVNRCKFKLFWGNDAKMQPTDIPDMLLHETAVSWLRNVLRRAKPECVPWQESPEQWSRRMVCAVDEVNQKCDVEGLCRQFKERLEDCIEAGGDRIPH